MIDKVLIVDFGSQYTQLIARRVRELKIYSEVLPYNKVVNFNGYRCVILSGGPASLTEKEAPLIDVALLNGSVPVLGVCYGEQLICKLLGGDVTVKGDREFGKTPVTIHKYSALLKGVWGPVGSCGLVWMSHSDHINSVPDGFVVQASSAGAPFAVIADEVKNIYGIQFHPEVSHTENGEVILKNFLVDIAGCRRDWDIKLLAHRIVDDVRERVVDRKVIAAVSGGVDSTVAAALVKEAIGDNLRCIFVDNGLLRKNEAEEVVKNFKNINMNVVHVGKREHNNLFIESLRGVTDPEGKRKIIGKCFIDVFMRYANDAEMLLQGTLYPDVIESIAPVGDKPTTIKSHHNVGGLPDIMNIELLEPLRSFFKDEVRELGRALQIPDDMLLRHPFPGPGLAIRVPGEVGEDELAILREADAIFIDGIKEAGLYHKIWQAFAVLLPIKTVGVMGDVRTYEHVCVLRAVHSVDGMTARPYYFNGAFIDNISSRIVNNVRGINRVAYDCTSKPPATIEWE